MKMFVMPLVLAAMPLIASADTILISKTAESTLGNATSYWPDLSANGRWVVFSSEADNLIPDDTNGLQDVFLVDSVTGQLTLVSRDVSGNVGNGASDEGIISANGRFIAFSSQASNLTAFDFNERMDIFVVDRDSDADGVFDEPDEWIMRSVSVKSDGTQIIGGGDNNPAISGDGRFIAFTSNGQFVDEDTDNFLDIYLHDRDTDADGTFDEIGGVETLLVTSGSNGDSERPFLSENGSIVAFQSLADTLVADDTNGHNDVFIYTVADGSIQLISRQPDGRVSAGASGAFDISSNGQFITFFSSGEDLVANDSNGQGDLFIFDRTSGTVRLASVGQSGSSLAAQSDFGSISDDGSLVLFMTAATGAADNQDLGFHIYLRNLESEINYRVSVDSIGNAANNISIFPSISGDGTSIAFQSLADNLVLNDVNGQYDIFHVELADLSLAIQSNSGSVLVGGDAMFVVEIANNTGLPARNVLLSIPVPANAVFLQGSITGSFCAPAGNIIECSVSLLEPGQAVTGTLTFEAQAIGSLELQGAVQGDLPDAFVDDNADAATVNVQTAIAPPGNGSSGGGGGGVAPVILVLLAFVAVRRLCTGTFRPSLNCN